MITIENLKFSYTNMFSINAVINGLNLFVDDGEFLCVIGNSGCGKSTLLRLIAGLDKADEGQIVIDGIPVEKPSSDRTIMFQHYSLLPWLTVYDNVTFALKKSHKFNKDEIFQRTNYFIEKVGLTESRDYYPYQLSGGMHHRAAIARALALDSPYLLLDEPFGALDTKIRKELQELLRDLWQSSQEKKTVIFVTHDLDEALIMGTRIAFLGNGIITHEKRISDEINCCCSNNLGQGECLSLKEEMSRWYSE